MCQKCFIGVIVKSEMPFKWKCINSSYLVLKGEKKDNEDTGVSGIKKLKNEADDNEQTDVSGIGVQSVSNFEANTPILKELQCSGITDLQECDTKNGITAWELCGSTVNNESYDSMLSSQLFTVDTEETETYIKQEPVEDTENKSTSNDCGVSAGVKCAVFYKDTGDNSAEKGISVMQKHEHRSCDSEKEYISIVNQCIQCTKCFDTTSDLINHLIDSHTDKKILCIRSHGYSGKLTKHPRATSRKRFTVAQNGTNLSRPCQLERSTC